MVLKKLRMPTSSAVQSLSHHLRILADPRVGRTREHALHDILMIALLAMLCGTESFADFADFDRVRQEWLRGLGQQDGPHHLGGPEQRRNLPAIHDRNDRIKHRERKMIKSLRAVCIRRR